MLIKILLDLTSPRKVEEFGLVNFTSLLKADQTTCVARFSQDSPGPNPTQVRQTRVRWVFRATVV